MASLPKTLPTFVYNDEFDKEHYKVKDWHLDELILVHQHLDLPDGGQWVYFATIHGITFKYEDAGQLHPARCLNRLDKSDLDFFGGRSQLRWFEPGEKSFEIALTHHENGVIK